MRDHAMEAGYKEVNLYLRREWLSRSSGTKTGGLLSEARRDSAWNLVTRGIPPGPRVRSLIMENRVEVFSIFTDKDKILVYLKIEDLSSRDFFLGQRRYCEM